jgi:hypothetical protein
MDNSNRDRTPAELAHVAAKLRAERATATPLELDRIKLRAMRGTERPRSSLYARKKGTLMKSRLALTLMLVAGFMLSTTGATLAITGSSGSGSAAQNQYESVLPTNEGGGNQGGNGNNQLGGNTQGVESTSTEPVATEQVQVASDSSGSLPFTGFVAIPLLIVGLGLLAFGAVLRRKTSHGDSIGG